MVYEITMLACRNCFLLFGRHFTRSASIGWHHSLKHLGRCALIVRSNTFHLQPAVTLQQVFFSNESPKDNSSQSESSTIDYDQSESSTNENDQSASEEQNYDQSEDDTDDIRQKILGLALDHVIDHGWSRQALSIGAEEAGYAGVAEGMFKESDLVLYFVRESNLKLNKYLQENADKYKDSKSKMIRDAIEFRLRLLIPYINVWPSAMKMLLNPKVFSESANELGHMVDDIWHHAGDQSSDFNWYTKRAMLAKVYTTTQLFILNDQSPDFVDTWEFLDRRFADLKTIGRVTRGMQETCNGVYDVTTSGFTVLRNVVGVPRKER